MTKEEAIEILNYLKSYYNDKDECGYVEFDAEDNEAIDMGIEKLTQNSQVDQT